MNDLDGQPFCKACELGSEPDANKKQCQPCQDGYVTPRKGAFCQKCPEMTVPSADKTYCEPEKHLVWY